MKRIPLLIAAITLGSVAYAQQNVPGAHFIENWDFNEDGQVTKEEAVERRGDIFTTFDENDDGILSASDYAAFDEARAADHESMPQGGGMGQGKGMGQGGGMGQGKGMGQGRGMGTGGGQYGRGEGMTMQFNDVNSDGQVSREEFMARTDDWYAMMDKNGDGTITAADFGRGNN
jgi:hypothetical protein